MKQSKILRFEYELPNRFDKEVCKKYIESYGFNKPFKAYTIDSNLNIVEVIVKVTNWLSPDAFVMKVKFINSEKWDIEINLKDYENETEGFINHWFSDDIDDVFFYQSEILNDYKELINDEISNISLIENTNSALKNINSLKNIKPNG